MGSDPVDDHSGVEVRGTIAIIIFIGVVLVVTWFGAYLLFLSRN